MDRNRLRPGPDQNAVGLGKLLLVGGGAHIASAAPIDQGHRLGAQFLDLNSDVDGCIAAADDHHPPPYGQRGLVPLTNFTDEVDRIVHAPDLFVRQAKRIDRIVPQAKKHRVIPVA